MAKLEELIEPAAAIVTSGNFSLSQAISLKRIADSLDVVRNGFMQVARDPAIPDHKGFTYDDYRKVALQLRSTCDLEHSLNELEIILAALDQCGKAP